jgi:homoserine dehydrogenase
MSEVRIGLLGYGTVGSAFAKLIDERGDAVEAATGRRPVISGVLRRSEGDFAEILDDSDVIVELIGGLEPAREHVLAALTAGKPVVTANKQLVARYGDELFEAARANDVQLRFEAAVAGAIPIIRVVSESLGTIEIDRVAGIVNGTTNFILSEMASTGADYGEVLGGRERRGCRGQDGDPGPARLRHRRLARRRDIRGHRGDPPRRHVLRAGAGALAEAPRRR